MTPPPTSLGATTLLAGISMMLLAVIAHDTGTEAAAAAAAHSGPAAQEPAAAHSAAKAPSTTTQPAAKEPAKPQGKESPAPASQAPTTTAQRPSVPLQVRPEDMMFQFGVIPPLETARQLFVVHNDSDSPVTIRKVKPSCGCAAVDYPKVIPAHGRGVFEVALSGKTLKQGKISHHLDIEASDPNFWLVIIEAHVDPKLGGPPKYSPQIEGAGLLIR